MLRSIPIIINLSGLTFIHLRPNQLNYLDEKCHGPIYLDRKCHGSEEADTQEIWNTDENHSAEVAQCWALCTSELTVPRSLKRLNPFFGRSRSELSQLDEKRHGPLFLDEKRHGSGDSFQSIGSVEEHPVQYAQWHFPNRNPPQLMSHYSRSTTASRFFSVMGSVTCIDGLHNHRCGGVGESESFNGKQAMRS